MQCVIRLVISEGNFLNKSFEDEQTFGLSGVASATIITLENLESERYGELYKNLYHSCDEPLSFLSTCDLGSYLSYEYKWLSVKT